MHDKQFQSIGPDLHDVVLHEPHQVNHPLGASNMEFMYIIVQKYGLDHSRSRYRGQWPIIRSRKTKQNLIVRSRYGDTALFMLFDVYTTYHHSKSKREGECTCKHHYHPELQRQFQEICTNYSLNTLKSSNRDSDAS